jgi:hypothetical protein
MQKRTSYEFEGKCGYSYVTKAYSSNDVKFEVHFRVNENDTDTLQFGVDWVWTLSGALSMSIRKSWNNLPIVKNNP